MEFWIHKVFLIKPGMYTDYFTGHWRAAFQSLSIIPGTHNKNNKNITIKTKI